MSFVKFAWILDQ